ncbi:hypothetical protein ASF28_01485 [Methylobacterium sp. Leaf99]|uniref:MAPEG family protein n=1 Tax=Methylobacterium sp. Leaf99 TaxID=1736251 RepID=UPI0006F51BB5|nr:MAPEG family protein [Methylobacterium sp. Leaf99]KQP09880.1 hypothetical protein ASF28_01485 [Methylobacterium sp. Leaf99]
MTVQAILAPVFVQVLLTFALGVWMGRVRFAAVSAGGVKVGDIALGQKAWPARAQQAANAYANQFELPVLFYALVPLAFATRKADLFFVVLAWMFVATRIVHAGVFITTNHVPYRFRAFVAGVVVLLVMWVVFAVRLLAS